MQRRHLAIGVVSAMLASVALAPAAGAFTEKINSGATGDYQIEDDDFDPGVNCRYEDNPGTKKDELNKIRVTDYHAHGPYVQKTWVGSRFIIKRNAKPHGDNKFKTVFKSRIRKGKANQFEVAFFTAKSWFTPENHKSRYRVVIELIFYKKGSKTKVAGRVKGPMDVYLSRQGTDEKPGFGDEGGPSGWCYTKWHQAPS